ncbi:O-antigen ligase family protein [Saccharothrix sp. AJ9571]|nr:O-antigen ligase family protein [Saccharothrix sp. AJ9571]
MQTAPFVGKAEPIWKRIDGAGLVCIYLAMLLIIPARLVFSRIPMTLAPTIAFAALLGVLWLCSQLVDTLGVAKGHNAPRVALTCFLAANLITYGVATRRHLPDDELNLADSGLIRITAMTALGVFLCDTVTVRERLNRLLRVLVGVIAVCAGIGLVQFALDLDLTQYLQFPGLKATSEYSNPERASFRRPSGTTNHPIEFGVVCAMAIPFAAHYLFRAMDRGEPRWKWALSLSMVGGGALVSLSRTAILSLAVVILVVIASVRGRRRLIVAGMSIGFAAAAVLAIPGLFGTLYGLFANIDSDPSVTSRTDDYDEAWRHIGLHPIAGRGFGTFLPDKYLILDNQYLMTLIENGWIGLVTFVGMFVVGVYAAVRVIVISRNHEMRGLAGAMISAMLIALISAATFDLLSFSVIAGLSFFSVGLCGSLLRIARAENPPRARVGRVTWTEKLKASLKAGAR